ncbi:hypothetical protein CE91St48_28370 [Emergencia timonensis]|nr:hypothetical protein CE91St48_28370 [Emergencia timonensis]
MTDISKGVGAVIVQPILTYPVYYYSSDLSNKCERSVNCFLRISYNTVKSSKSIASCY